MNIPEPGRHELLRLGLATHSLAIVVAAALVGYSLPDPPRPPVYAGLVVGGKIVRLDTYTGDIIACDARRCAQLLGNGRAIESAAAPGRHRRAAPSSEDALRARIQECIGSLTRWAGEAAGRALAR